MRGKWGLTQEEQEKYIPYIKECINKLSLDEDISLNDTPLNPENLRDIMRELGYTETNFDTNGWEYDFWITFEKTGKPKITVCGCGITFDLRLAMYDE